MTTAEELLGRARSIAEGWLWTTQVHEPEPNRMDVTLTNLADLVPMVVMLRVQRMGYLAAITGLDLGPESGALEVLYHFCTGPVTITLRVRLPRSGATLPSLVGVIPSAETLERELVEMFGIPVTGMRTTDRLYLPDDWPDGVYPLRKDCDPQTALLGA
jgi:Ni,Fe-hydrogenase III component G